jgi:hypothetical protein
MKQIKCKNLFYLIHLKVYKHSFLVSNLIIEVAYS